MRSDRKDIKMKIDQLDKEIKLLENKINEISWQRLKYQEFYDKSIITKADHCTYWYKYNAAKENFVDKGLWYSSAIDGDLNL